MTIEIKQVQRHLNLLGFGPLVVDGINGPRTSDAIARFRASIGLSGAPVLDEDTLEALMARRDAPGLPWLSEAIAVKALHETKDRPRLRAWFDRAVRIDPREIPWCGAFVATCLRKWRPEIQLPDNPLGARAWATWGRQSVPQLGAVLVFWRGRRDGWQGHVGFYWGEDDSAYHVLGGNQSDAVTVTRIAKTRLLAARWPADFAQPETPAVIRLSPSGQPLSQNEA